MSDTALVAGFAALLLAIYLLLERGRRRRRPRRKRPLVVLDGSNVMHWGKGKPDLATVEAVLRLARARGYRPGVIFDANAGYLLTDRYMNEAQFGLSLGLPTGDVFVVPKGTQADPFLLDHASDSGAILISNDRFRDRIAGYPALAAPGRLVRGGFRDGALWLDLPEA